MPTQEFYVFECKVDGCVAEFWLNDVPIARRGPDLGTSAVIQSNELVFDGLNEIAMVIHPGPTPGEAIAGEGRRRTRLPAKGASASARLAKYPRGAITGGPDAEVLLSVSWNAPGEVTVPFPRVESAVADLGPLLGRWSFQDAPRLVLDDSVPHEIDGFLTTIGEALAAGTPDALIQLSQTRLDEITAAFDLEEGEKEKFIRMMTEQDAQEPHWGILPIEPAQFDLRLCGQGKLLQVIRKDWEPPLREKPSPDGGQGTYPMFLARIDESWQIVR